jgi:hypothetical protein
MNKHTNPLGAALAALLLCSSNIAYAGGLQDEKPDEWQGEFRTPPMKGLALVNALGASSWLAVGGSLAPVTANSFYLANGSKPSTAWLSVGYGMAAVDLVHGVAGLMLIDDSDYQTRVVAPVLVAGASSLATTAMAHALGRPEFTVAPTMTVQPNGATRGRVMLSGSF